MEGENMELAARKNGGIAQGDNNPAYETEMASPDAIRVFTQSDLNHLTVHQAAREGDVAIMERVLERYPNNQQKKKRINSKDDSKLTPLHYAARYNHYAMMQYLIKNGANVNAKGEDGATAMHFLAKYKKKKLVPSESADKNDSESEDEEPPPPEAPTCLRLLQENGAQINVKDLMGLTPLHHACTRGNTSAIRELIEFPGMGLEMTDHQGMTALHLACLYSKKSIVRLLIEAGANMRARDKDMTTPFHLACAEGCQPIAELLLEKANELAAEEIVEENGKDKEKEGNYASIALGVQRLRTALPNGDNREVAKGGSGGPADMLKDTDGERNLPLHLAIENGHLELVKFCIEKGIEYGLGPMVDQSRSRDESCLHLSVLSNNLDIVKLLLQHGADVNARNSSLASPLFVASQYNAHGIVKYLLQNGASVDMKDNDFCSPLLIASRYGHLETMTHLLDHNADIAETDKDDKTCIIWAAEEDRTDALGLLLRYTKGRALIEERDRYNNTALHMASSKGHVNAVKLLLEFRAPADIKNDDDRTTLHMAALNGNDLIIPELISRDRTILNAGDEDANAALHLAAMSGNLKCVDALIQLGANIELRNAKQWTPLDCAAANGWEKPARALLEAGAAVQPRGKIKIKVCALHLACQNGHLEMANLLLAWRADVTFRSADGKNSLDFAIDHNQKDCVYALIKHTSWKNSLRNSVIDPVNGRMFTPMRKLIKRMPDMAEFVCNQCLTDNGKKPEDDDYKITLLYEFLDDMYASSAWSEYPPKEVKKDSNDTYSQLSGDDSSYTVYDDNGHLTSEATTYLNDSDELQRNHPLKIMFAAQREELLLHPVVTGLLNYKWRKFGRYVYYSNLFLFVVYLVLLNVYMLTMPPPYQINWPLECLTREALLTNQSDTARIDEIKDAISPTVPESTACYYFRQEVIEGDSTKGGCHTLPQEYNGLKWTIFAFSVFNLVRELFQLVNQRLRYISEFTNTVEVTLYVLSLLMTLNFTGYSTQTFLKDFDEHTYNTTVINCEVYFEDLQNDTGLRQEWQLEVGAFAVFLSWMGLLLFIQKIPYLGIFVVMFTDILKTFAQFLFVFAFFILGFAFAYYILIGNQYVFQSPGYAIIKTIVMMIGELDYGSIFFGAADAGDASYHTKIYTNSVSLVLFTIFLIVMTIIIMNLLVGLAVGDIIEVQSHATLERLGMQVDLALDVEFTIPSFLRKKVCLRKQMLEVNKYRKANIVKKTLFQDSDLTVEHITKALNREKGDQDEMKNSLDRVLTGMGRLRNRLTDVISEQTEVKMGIFGIRSQVRDARAESKMLSRDIKTSVQETKDVLGGQIGKTHEGLERVTERESTDTRTRVDSTQQLIAGLREDIDRTSVVIAEVKSELQARMTQMQEELMSRDVADMEKGLAECNEKIERTRGEVLQSLEEMKMILVKEKYMTSV